MTLKFSRFLEACEYMSMHNFIEVSPSVN